MEESLAGGNEAPWLHYSVLVVDDEPGMVSFLQRALSSRCGLVDCADSVEAARSLFRRNRYDLIVLDIALPGVSGIDWLHELRQD
ncbi:MAG: response regulator, partial [Dechloromonas sp.]|nr:response regulator [Dechloromonas sp.]